MALHALREELGQLGCQVVVVGWTLRETALKWQRKHGLDEFPVLLDPELKLYRQLGLRRSVIKLWQLMLLNCAQREVAKLSDPVPWKGDDVQVMGGDFIADSSGKLLYSYPCKSPVDRPDIAELLEVIKSLN